MSRPSTASVVLATAALAIAAGPAGAVNVIQNPGAEADPVGQPASGWTAGAGAGFESKAYGGTFPGTDVAAANNGGTQFFWAGNTPEASMSQTYTPTADEITRIDAGRTEAVAAADLGGWSFQDDQAVMTVIFRDASGGEVGSRIVVGPVTSGDRRGQVTLLRRTSTGPVPAGTRAIEVVLVATRRGGASNDGYVDNVFLELREAASVTPPPPPPDTRGIPNPTVRTDGPAVVVAPGRTSLAGCRRGQRKSVRVRVQSSDRGDVFVSIFSGVSSVRLFGSRWVTFGRPGSRRVGIQVPCPAKTADVRTVGLGSTIASVEPGDRRGIATPQAVARGGAVVIGPRARPVRRLRSRPIVEVRVRTRKAGRVVVRVRGRGPGLRLSGRTVVRFSSAGVRLVRVRVRVRGTGRRGNAAITLVRPRVLR